MRLSVRQPTRIVGWIGMGACFGALLLGVSSRAAAAPFTAGDLVVVRVGTGAAALNSNATAVFLDEYTATGTLVQSIPLPTSASGSNHQFANSGTATTEGALARSVDGRHLTLAGYDAAPGTTSVVNSASPAYSRLIAVVDVNGNIDTTTVPAGVYVGRNIQSAVTTDGSNLWTGGSGLTTDAGVQYTTVGSTSSTQIVATSLNVRVVSIQAGFGGSAASSQVLYYSTGTGAPGIYRVGSPPPTTLQVPTLVVSATSSTCAYAFLDRDATVPGVDTLYVADQTAANGLLKFSYNGTLWTARGNVAVSGGVGGGLTGLSAAGTGSSATLFATSGTTAGNKIVKLVDAAAFNATISGSFTNVVTASANTVFRGIQIAPSVTAVRLEAATAAAYPGGVAVQWRTGYEVRNLGFNIYRDASGGAPLNPVPVAGSALVVGARTGLPAGGYCFWDPHGLPGSRYYLEDVDLDGTHTWHGPFIARPGAGPAPALSGSPALAAPGRYTGTDEGSATGSGGPLLRAALLPALGTGAWSGAEDEPAGLALSGRRRRKPPQPPVVLKVRVAAEGWYRITGKQLLAAGLAAATDPRRLRLTVDGKDVPLRVLGARDGRLQAADALEFYGLGLDTPSTDSRVYWLTVATAPQSRLTVLNVPGTPGPDVFAATVERRERITYFGNLKNGEADNFFGPLVGGSAAVEQALTVDHLGAPPPVGADGATLRVALQGVTELSGTPDHRVRVSLNGRELGLLLFDGQERGEGVYPVPRSLLRQGSNSVAFRTEGGALDYSLVESVRLTYWREYAADADVLRCTAAGGHEVTLTGFGSASIHVVDVTDPDRSVGLAGEVQRAAGGGYSYTVGVAGSGARTLYAFTDAAARAPADLVREQASAWKSYRPGADLLIVTNGELTPALAPLVQARLKAGLQAVVVNIEDVYDEFSGGQKDPAALKAFLQEIHGSKSAWSRKPRFLLLAGDASLDPRGFLGHGRWDLVPTRLAETALFETASDDWFVDFNGDGLPELAVGRLPARTAAELSLLVSKTLAFEAAGGTGSGKALLVADGAAKGSFVEASRGLKDLLPPALAVQEVAGTEADPAAARKAVLSALGAGLALVNYQGHGSTEVWAHGVLSAADARGLENGRLPLAVLMTCLNGYFQDAGALSDECLGKALLTAPRGGAAAVWASTGLTSDGPQAALNRELYHLLFGGVRPSLATMMTLGEATMRAKSGVSDPDVRRTWVLLGDPSARAR